MFEKKFKDFIEENHHITLLGLAWALFWRLYAVLLISCVLIAAIGNLFN